MEYIYIFSSFVFILFQLKILRSNIKTGLITILLTLTFALESLPWYLIPISGVALSFFAFLNVIVLCYALIYTSYKDRNLFKYIMWLFMFFFTMIFYLLLSKSPDYGATKIFFFLLKNVIPVISLFLLTPLCKKDYKNIFYTLLSASILTSVKVLTVGSDNFSRSVDNPLTHARIIGLGIVLLTMFMMNRKKNRLNEVIVSVLASSIMFIGVFQTGSRGPLLGIFVVFIYYFLLVKSTFSKKIKKGIYLLLIILFVVSSAIYIEKENIDLGAVNRLTGFLTTLIFPQKVNISTVKSDTERLMLFSMAYNSIRESNGLGIGTGSFLQYSGYSYPHNVFLEIFSELGIMGFGLFIYLIVRSMFRHLHNINRSSKYLFALSHLWIFALSNAIAASDISKNLLWISLIFIWVTSDTTKYSYNKVGI